MRDQVDDALETLDKALRRNLDRVERSIKRAEELRNAHAEGKTWTEVARAEERPMILEMISANLDELYQAGGRLRRVMAKALHDEGMSMEQIARLFGVTRQRVSALLREPRSADERGQNGDEGDGDALAAPEPLVSGTSDVVEGERAS